MKEWVFLCLFTCNCGHLFFISHQKFCCTVVSGNLSINFLYFYIKFHFIISHVFFLSFSNWRHILLKFAFFFPSGYPHSRHILCNHFPDAEILWYLIFLLDSDVEVSFQLQSLMIRQHCPRNRMDLYLEAWNEQIAKKSSWTAISS